MYPVEALRISSRIRTAPYPIYPYNPLGLIRQPPHLRGSKVEIEKGKIHV